MWDILFQTNQERRRIACGSQMERLTTSWLVQIVLALTMAWLISSHLSVKEKTELYVDRILHLNFAVEDLKDNIKSDTVELVAQKLLTETKKMEAKYAEIIEANLGQIETKIIQLEAKNIQLKETADEYNQMRKDLEAKVKQLETKVKHQELLIFALQNERLSPTESSSQPALSRTLGISFTGESGDYRTCHGIHSIDPSLPSGMYWIDPDGKGVGDDPIYVYCNMTSGTTSVKHDSESPMDVGHCAGIGCYSRTITYNATMEQLSMLAKYSSECHQSIRYDCRNAPLESKGISYSWWNDRSGSAKYFWSGIDDDENEHTCQCGIEGNCVDSNVKCNCDTLNPDQLFDSGVITDRNLLPITKLNFGRTQLATSSGVHTLGSFECSGQVTAVMPASCEDLWRIGHTLSGLYLVKGIDMIETVFCDFKKLPDETGFQKWIGFNGVKSYPTVFMVWRVNKFYEVGVLIPFENYEINTGEAMDLETGIFTANRAGSYFFSFSGFANFPAKSSLKEMQIVLYLNDNKVSLSSVDGVKDSKTFLLTQQVVLSLLPDDQISLGIHSNSRDSYLSYMTFLGWMLEEKMVDTFL